MAAERLCLWLLSLLVVYSVVNFQNDIILQSTYLTACVVVGVTHIRQANVLSLVILLILFRCIEILILLLFFDAMNAYLFYSVIAFLQCLTIVTLYLRAPLSRGISLLITGETKLDHYFMTRADLAIVYLHIVDFWINIAMLFEHLLRNLDDIGLPQNQWLYLNARLVYNQYEMLSIALAVLQTLFVLAASAQYFKEQYKFKA